jgi:GNAT superfamily N-acetyltransferase
MRRDSVAPMNEIEIRRATVDDIDGLVRSTAALFAADAAKRDRLRSQEWPNAHGTQWCSDLIANPSAIPLVAVGEVVVGHLIGTFAEASEMWTGSRAELVSMFVSPALRGHGIGNRLVEEFIAWARGRGAARLQVSAYADNHGAIRFYHRHGFRPHSTELVIDL